MLKHLRQSTLLRCFVILAFVFFLLPLSPNDAYADELIIILGVVAFVLLMPHIVPLWQDDNEQKPVAEKDDKEKVLAERFAKLNTDKDGVTYSKGRDTLPVFEW